jgi:protease-4
VDQVYGHFKRDVITFRREKGLDLNAFETVNDGRILTGWQAMDAGLIDEIGSKEEAIQKAAELGGITGTPNTKIIEHQTFSLRDFLFSMGSQFGKGVSAGIQSSAAIPSSTSTAPVRAI